MRSRALISLLLLLTATSASAQEREIDPTVGPDPFRAKPQGWMDAPVSASGTELLPKPPPPTPPAAATDDARLRRLEARIEQLEAEKGRAPAKNDWAEHVRLGALVQAQLLWRSYNASASPNATPTLPTGISANGIVARPDGTTTNDDAFRLRRAVFRGEFMPTEHTKLVMELDPSMVAANGVSTSIIARNVEAALIVPWTRDVETTFGMGIIRLPFGYEMQQPDWDTVFVERSWAQNNMFPGQFDTGAYAYTSALRRRLGVQLAITNGSTLAEKNFLVVPDLNRGKDAVGRVRYDFGPFDVGVSAVAGKGQLVDGANLRFKQYARWAMNVEAAFHHELIRSFGMTRILGELTLAQNMDRGLHYASPAIPSDIDSAAPERDERGLFVRLEQDVTRWATVGARYDFYTPDAAQKNDARDTYAFVAAANFTRALRLFLEFNHVLDDVHAPGARPPVKRIETFTATLQGHF